MVKCPDPRCVNAEVVIDSASGIATCTFCSTIIQETHIVSSIEFTENSGVNGTYVNQSGTSSRAPGARRHYTSSQDSLDASIYRGKQKVKELCSMLGIHNQHHIDAAGRCYALAVQFNFTSGRSLSLVACACIYVVCRQEKTPHLLIDFSEKLSVNVFRIGSTFLKLCQILHFRLPIIDPSLYIHRFTTELNIPEKELERKIARTSLTIIASMKRDWMDLGRHPSGICGAALLISAKIHKYELSRFEVMNVVNIHDQTLRKRLVEFALTPSALLTVDEIEKNNQKPSVACDPPSFTKNRQKEAIGHILSSYPTLGNDFQVTENNKNLKINDVLKNKDISRLLEEVSATAIVEMNKKQEELLKKQKEKKKEKEKEKEKENVEIKTNEREKDVLLAPSNSDALNNKITRQLNRNYTEILSKEVVSTFRKKNKRKLSSNQLSDDLTLQIEKDIESSLTQPMNENTEIKEPSEKPHSDDEINEENQNIKKRKMDHPINDVTDPLNDPIPSLNNTECIINKEIKENNIELIHEQEANTSEGEEIIEEILDNSDDEPINNNKDENDSENDDNNKNNIKKNKKEEELFKNIRVITDEEIDELLLSKEEVVMKTKLWESIHADYIKEQEEKRKHKELNALNNKENKARKRTYKKRKSDETEPEKGTIEYAIHVLKKKSKLSSFIDYNMLHDLVKKPPHASN